ncbi:MAG: hypothetical protein JNL80_00835 [Phycisphaerae bacterium]|nr:hypothetical protein [Phycisphaerae bacterium]
MSWLVSRRLDFVSCPPASRRALRVAALMLAVAASSATSASPDTNPPEGQVRLEHLGRYNRQPIGRDHLVGAIPILDHYALTCSYDALRVIDLNALPSGNGTGAFVSELRGNDVYSLVAYDQTHVYAHLRLGGFGVVRIDPISKAITWVKTIAEAGVYYESMSIAGNRLYVAAHADGLRVFDLSDPEDPVLLGAVTKGLDDAFAVDILNRHAYVADGAGGLKIVDVRDPGAMHVVAGEHVGASAIGTAEDVLVIDGNVYVAAGSEGVLSYRHGDLSLRSQFQTPGIAKGLARIGEHLAVADITGITIMRLGPQASLEMLTSEGGLRRFLPDNLLSLRLWHGVAGWGENRVIAANWDAVDVYSIIPLEQATQPDATLSDQRLRFHVDGSAKTISLQNRGGGPLQVSTITSNAPANFSATPTGPLTIAPGGAVDLTITYTPGTLAKGIVHVNSNDPDEAKLPIEVFGDTSFLDPGEPATPFTLPMWSFDHASGTFAQRTFSLAAQEGKVVYFQIFGTWCPACLPVIADVQNALASRFETHPQVVLAIMSQKESASLLQQYWSNIYLRLPLLFDLPGTASFVAYAQPPSGLPFSRGFLVGPDQVIKETWFGFNADRVVKAINHQLLRIAIDGDANLDGHVDSGDVLAVINAWGFCDDPAFCPADQNGDGMIDWFDLAMVYRHFGDVAE